jgi:hypothetical protein
MIMKQHFFSVSTLVLAVALVFSACSKEGPAGPAGAQGPAGPTGPAGVAGVAGPAGTANVFYSAWLDATPTALQSGEDVIYADTIRNVTKLDAGMVSNGIMKVYLNFGTAAAPDVTALPDFIFAPINPYFSVGSIELIGLFDYSTFLNEQNQKRYQIRYVLVPGGVPAKYDVDWNSYAAVQKFLNLKD